MLDDDEPTFDLQSHSRHSDGALRPAEVVRAAAAAGVKLLALSDHDTVAGVAEAIEAGKELGVGIVPAVEVSAVDRGGTSGDLHILGYGVDHLDNVFEERLSTYRDEREHRAWAMVARLRAIGFQLDERPIYRRLALGESVGRPHLAEAAVNHPANVERLQDEGIAEPSAFLEAYLIEDKPAFVSRRRPSVHDAIGAIHDAGGQAVWAHPFWDVKEETTALNVIDRFVAIGLDGVECFYISHTEEQSLLLADRCAQLGLLATGSSDFHGPKHRMFSRFRAFSTFGRSPTLGLDWAR